MQIKNSIFYISIALVVLTHISALFIELSESMWLGHNVLMIVAGIAALMSRK